MVDLLADFENYLRLHVARGDSGEHTIRSYETHARQYLDWCTDHDVDPATVTEEDIVAYRHNLLLHYTSGSCAVKLAAVRRLYEAAQRRGIRADHPAVMVKAPKDKTDRAEAIRFLSHEGLRRVLNAPAGDGLAARRDRAMLAAMGRHGLRVHEVAWPDLEDVDFGADAVHVLGKGGKRRTVYLVGSTTAASRDRLAVRADVANEGETAPFVSLDHCSCGTRLTMQGRACRQCLPAGGGPQSLGHLLSLSAALGGDLGARR